MSTDIIETILNTLVVPFLIYGIKALIAYFQSKSSNEKLTTYIQIAGEAVESAVAEVSQTFVDGLKKQGAWSADTAAEAANMAYHKALDLMGEGAVSGLNMLMGDAQGYITARIEKAVRDAKK